jgi:hypothetical protein
MRHFTSMPDFDDVLFCERDGTTDISKSLFIDEEVLSEGFFCTD